MNDTTTRALQVLRLPVMPRSVRELAQRTCSAWGYEIHRDWTWVEVGAYQHLFNHLAKAKR